LPEKGRPGGLPCYLRLDPNVRPGLLLGIEGLGAGRDGAGAARGVDRFDPLPNVRPLESPPGFRIAGVEYWLSRYPPGLLAYFESLKPPFCAKVVPAYRSCVVVPCVPYFGAEFASSRP